MMYETHTNQTYYRLFDSVEDVITEADRASTMILLPEEY